MPSRTFIRTSIACLFALGVAGCETSDITDKISDLNPFGTAKKPLPGVRQPVFPNGAPGVQQGVPAELMPGYQPPPEEPAARVAEPKPKAAARRRAQTAAAPPARRAPRSSAAAGTT